MIRSAARTLLVVVVAVTGLTVAAPANAADTTISDAASCVAAGGSVPGTRCELRSYTVRAGDSLTISFPTGFDQLVVEPQGTLINQDVVDVRAELTLRGAVVAGPRLRSYGSLTNAGSVTVPARGSLVSVRTDLVNTGTIDVSGEVQSFEGLQNSGTIALRCGASLRSAKTPTGNPPVDRCAPGLTVTRAAGQADPSSSPELEFLITATEPVTRLFLRDVEVTGGPAPFTSLTPVGDDRTTFRLSVSGYTGTGTITVAVAPGAVQDDAGNPSTAAAPVSNRYDLPPTVRVEQASDQADPTGGTTPVRFTATFSEPVTGLEAADVVRGGTAPGGTVAVSGGGTTWTISVSGFSGSGTVTASLPAGAAQDVAGNGSAASTSQDAQVTYDLSAPVITPVVTGPQGTDGWYTGDVTVTWTTTDPESAVTRTGCDPVTITADTAGTTSSCAASSTGGAVSRSVTVKRDATAPTVSARVQPDPVAQGAVATATPTASDATSGVAAQDCDPVSTAAAGPASVTCTAVDRAGNRASTTAPYTVLAPVVVPPAVVPPAPNADLSVAFTSKAPRWARPGTVVRVDLTTASSGPSATSATTTLRVPRGWTVRRASRDTELTGRRLSTPSTLVPGGTDRSFVVLEVGPRVKAVLRAQVTSSLPDPTPADNRDLLRITRGSLR